MAGYYDPNKDYSAAIEAAKKEGASQEVIAQLQEERANKIADYYGGKEPTMYNSDQTYTQLSGSGSDTANAIIGSAVSMADALAANGRKIGDTAGISIPQQQGNGYSTGGYTMGVYGTPILEHNPNWNYRRNPADMSRRPDLAGRTAISNGFLVTYDEYGYARTAGKGATDYAPTLDPFVADGTFTDHLWVDYEALSEEELEELAGYRAQAQRGEITWAEANALANEKVRKEHGYSVDSNGYITDYLGKSIVDGRRQQQGLPSGGVSEGQQYFLQNLLGKTDVSDAELLNLLNGVKQGTYTIPISNVGRIIKGDGAGGFYGDTEQLNAYYRSDLQARLDSLDAQNDKLLADYDEQDDLLTDQYAKAKNQLAAQNELERMYMNEMGAARGLNTGAAGQLALAQSVAYQGGMAELLAQEAADRAELERARQEVEAWYEAAVADAKAADQAALEDAVYQEGLKQDALMQDARERVERYIYMNGSLEGLPAELIEASGFTEAELLVMAKYYGGNAPEETPVTPAADTPVTNTPVTASNINNGGLSNRQIKALQRLYGVTPDGLWGPRSQAVGGTAVSAWTRYMTLIGDLSTDQITNSQSDKGIMLAREDGKGVIYCGKEELNDRLQTGEVWLREWDNGKYTMVTEA